MKSTLPIVTVLVLIGGCASGPRPIAELTRAHTLIEQAEKAGVQQYATAELQKARDQVAAADAANEKGRTDEARDLARLAASDAEFASAKAQQVKAESAAEDATKGVETLKKEADRNAEQSAPLPTAPLPTPTSSSPNSHP